MADKQEYVNPAILDLELDELKIGKRGRRKEEVVQILIFFLSLLYRDDEPDTI